MKRFLAAVLAALIAAPLAASIILPPGSRSVSRAGSLSDTFGNPAALPFRDEYEGDFLVSMNYGDNLLPAALDDGMGWVNQGRSSIALTFGGSYASVTAGLGYDLEDKRELEDGGVSYDMLSLLHFHADFAYSLWGFSVGARLQGGSALIRSDKRVDSFLDFPANFLFSPFDDSPGSEYFRLGLGAMWNGEWATVGLYTDNFLGTDSGELVFSGDAILDSLSVGATFHFPRFRSDGDLRLFAPAIEFQLGDMTGEEAYFMTIADLRFQLLPDVEITLSGAWLREGDGLGGLLGDGSDSSVFTLSVKSGSWKIKAEAEIPFGYYSGDTSRTFGVGLSLSYLT